MRLWNWIKSKLRRRVAQPASSPRSQGGSWITPESPQFNPRAFGSGPIASFTETGRAFEAPKLRNTPRIVPTPRYVPEPEPEPDLLDAALTSVLSTGAEIAAERAIESLFDGDSSSSPDTSAPDSPPDDYSSGGGGFGGGGASGDW